MYAEIYPEDLIDALAPVSALIDEARLNVSSDGIEIRAVDKANVGMVHMNIDESVFETLESEAVVIGVDLNKLNQQVKDIGSEPIEADAQIVQLELDTETRVLKLDGKTGSMTFSMSLLDPETIQDEPQIPHLDLPGVFEITSEYFSHIVRTANRFDSDTMRVTQDGQTDSAHMNVTGDTDSWEARMTETHHSVSEVTSTTPSETVESRLSIDYLNSMRKGIPTDTTVRVRVGDEKPLKLLFNYCDDGVVGEYMIAPRIAD